MTDFDQFIGTRAVPVAQAFDTAALEHWLCEHLEGFQGPLTV
ncbi:MAG: phosphotransferase family protein, partial [Comamonadaceae bacterium CG_4_9_14_0_8_um_filter_57_21]